MTQGAYRFGDCVLDGERFALLRDGRELKLERKPMELLLQLVENRSRLVSRDEIAERLWKGEVFVDTEHGINTAIRKIRTVLKDDSENPTYIQTVTGKGYRFVAAVEDVKPEASTVVEPSKPGESAEARPKEDTQAGGGPAPDSSLMRKRLWAGGLVAASCGLLVAGAFVGPHPLAARFLHRDGGVPINSIAVLPLENLSGDANQEYFADGMTDELTTMLAKASTLRVTSRMSVMQYKGARKPLPEIARALHVDAIVEGSVERSGNHVHMTLQLIRADTDSHVWADSFDCEESEVSTLPDSAARAIAKKLEHVEAAARPAQKINPEAHDAYLRGQYAWQVGRNKESGEYFQKAVGIQPDFADGWAGLSEYFNLEALEGSMNPTDVLPQGLAAARKAVELDDSLPLAHNSLGASILFSQWDAKGALQEVERGTQLDPQNSVGLHLQAKILCALDRFDEANAIQARSTAANAFAHPGARAEIFNCTRRFDDAIRDGLMRLRDMPDSSDILSQLSAAYHWTGHDKEAIDYLTKQYAVQGRKEISEAIRKAYASGGYHAAVRAELAGIQRETHDPAGSAIFLAQEYTLLGDREATIRCLNQAAAVHAPVLAFSINDPAFDWLHSDPRFQALAQRTGLPMGPVQ